MPSHSRNPREACTEVEIDNQRAKTSKSEDRAEIASERSFAHAAARRVDRSNDLPSFVTLLRRLALYLANSKMFSIENRRVFVPSCCRATSIPDSSTIRRTVSFVVARSWAAACTLNGFVDKANLDSVVKLG